MTNNAHSSILADKAMIANLTIGCWGGRIVDKEATAELLSMKSAEKTAGSFSKMLINKKHFKAIKIIINSIRQYHATVTMPWDNNGGRLLPSAKYSSYTAKLRTAQEELEIAVNLFINRYDIFKQEAEDLLGDLFDINIYPEKTELEEKFNIAVDFTKISEEEDFIVNLPDE